MARDNADACYGMHGMKHGIHFISGLPRAGSTLLGAILRQNPFFHAGMSSPVASLFSALLRQMSQENETAVFIDDAQRHAILTALFEAYYHKEHATRLVFDTNRMWCAKLPALAALFPNAKVICCVRHVPWILDSIERLVRRNKFEPSKIFNFDPGGTVYSRIEALGTGTGMVGFAWNALREAFYGEQSDRLLLLTYETLTSEPERALAAVYEFLGEAPFRHDFHNVQFDASEFDARLGTPGLHQVGRVVRAIERKTLLPPDLFRRVEPDSFWRDPALNPNRVTVV
jgi:sulfotransferase